MYAKTIIESSNMIAWQKAMEFVSKSPLKLTFGGGTEVKHALDSQVSIILDANAVNEFLNEKWHPSDPFCTPHRVKEYKNEYKKEFPDDVFDYTYRKILEDGFTFDEFSEVNQIEILKEGLKTQVEEQIGSNRNVAVLFNPAVDNFSGNAIPCLNEILVRWERFGWCSVHTTFRSHDLATAWNPNMLAMTEFINDEIAKPNHCKILYWSEHNYSLHIYEHDMHVYDNMIRVNRNPALYNLQNKYDSVGI